MAGLVGGLRKHPHGRVDQLEDRYLGMVEAPSSNLGTSTPLVLIQSTGVDRAATNLQRRISVRFVGSARPPETIHSESVGRTPKPIHSSSPRSLARHVHHSIDSLRPSFAAGPTHGPVRPVWCTKAIRRAIAKFTATTSLRGVAAMAPASHQRRSASVACSHGPKRL